jgi:hypothetical protein
MFIKRSERDWHASRIGHIAPSHLIVQSPLLPTGPPLKPCRSRPARALQLTRTPAGVQHEAGMLPALHGTPGASLFWHGRSWSSGALSVRGLVLTTLVLFAWELAYVREREMGKPCAVWGAYEFVDDSVEEHVPVWGQALLRPGTRRINTAPAGRRGDVVSVN